MINEPIIKLQDLINAKIEAMVERATNSNHCEWAYRYGGRYVKVRLLGLKSQPQVIRLEWRTNGDKVINPARAQNLIGQMLVDEGKAEAAKSFWQRNVMIGAISPDRDYLAYRLKPCNEAK